MRDGSFCPVLVPMLLELGCPPTEADTGRIRQVEAIGRRPLVPDSAFLQIMAPAGEGPVNEA